MKKFVLILFLPFCLQVSAQQTSEEKVPGFDKERLFSGGSVNVGFSNHYTALGATPQLGYSLTDWLDAGVNFNFNYISQRDIVSRGDKLRQTTYGPGAFVRLFPISMIFATAQYEYNFIRQKYIPFSSSGQPDQIDNRSAGSLLLGGGYAGGRQKGNNTYYFISVMWDFSGDKNSPYIDELGRSNPVIRAGYNIGLFKGKNRR
ncbi:MAG: hypothetical protein ABIN48_07535 [Ginsengibacter sp.]